MLIPVWLITTVVLMLIGMLVTAWFNWLKAKALITESLKQANAINQYKKQQQMAEIAQSNAEAANQAKNKYLSGISHELRTPLNVIMGYAQLLENKTATDDANYQSFHLIRKNCEHLTHLIEGILEFSAIESGKLRVQSDVIDLPRLLHQMIHMFSSQATQKGLKFKQNISPHTPQFVRTDAKRLKQILFNLLSNAIKFTQHGHVTFDVKYRSQIATFSIKDSGCGINKHDTDRIFQPFERLQTSNQNTTGTGLGLTIANLLTELLGGELSVKSTTGKGSVFTLKLMLSAQNTPAQANQTVVEPQKHNSHKILLVDDIEEHRNLMLNILQPYGFDLLTADSAEKAKKLIKEHDFDLLLLDVSMPIENGWSLAQWCREHEHTCQICMVSANPRDNGPHRQPHHQAYLAKPIQVNQLLTVINHLLKLGWEPTAKEIHQKQHINNIKIKRKDRILLL